MLSSFGLGAVAQLSLVLSGLAVFLVKVPRRTVGDLAGFGAGALIAAVAADLLPNAKLLEMWQVALWTMLGAGTFILGERYVDRKFGAEGSGGPLGIVVGAIVDGVPESIIFGVQMARGVEISLAFLAAVFVSNIPQALAPSAGLAESGWSWRRVAGMWLWVMLACGVAAAFGHYAATAFGGANGARAAAFGRDSGDAGQFPDSLCPRALRECRHMDSSRLLLRSGHGRMTLVCASSRARRRVPHH
jgi:ZIP family zinc transporter